MVKISKALKVEQKTFTHFIYLPFIDLSSHYPIEHYSEFDFHLKQTKHDSKWDHEEKYDS